MAKRITYGEYRQRVFNEAFLEALSKFHGMCLEESVEDIGSHKGEMRDKMARYFYRDLLKLDECTARATISKLSESATFIKDLCAVCESIAEEKANTAAEEKLQITDDQKTELSDEDKSVIDQVFDVKNPEFQASEIRDATVNALLAEEKKSQEIKDAVAIAKKDNNMESLEETARRLDHGPTSLMHAILNNFSRAAVKDVNESSNGIVPIGEVMKTNADEIKTRSVMLYSLYEMANYLGIHKYSAAEVKDIAEHIYYNK